MSSSRWEKVCVCGALFANLRSAPSSSPNPSFDPQQQPTGIPPFAPSVPAPSHRSTPLQQHQPARILVGPSPPIFFESTTHKMVKKYPISFALSRQIVQLEWLRQSNSFCCPWQYIGSHTELMIKVKIMLGEKTPSVYWGMTSIYWSVWLVVAKANWSYLIKTPNLGCWFGGGYFFYFYFF